MTYKESLFRMAVVGYCNSLPNIEKGTIPANVSFKEMLVTNIYIK